MKTVVSLGEILLRLSPSQYQTLTQATSLECRFGGSELNVLSTLVQLGHKVSLISAILANDLGRMTKTFLFLVKSVKIILLKKVNVWDLLLSKRVFLTG